METIVPGYQKITLILVQYKEKRSWWTIRTEASGHGVTQEEAKQGHCSVCIVYLARSPVWLELRVSNVCPSSLVTPAKPIMCHTFQPPILWTGCFFCLELLILRVHANYSFPRKFSESVRNCIQHKELNPPPPNLA